MTGSEPTWSLCGRTLDLSSGVLVGVINVTPDSFSDGGVFLQPETAISHGLALAADGAALIDVGGESTRPGATPVIEEEEVVRVVPVVRGLVDHGIDVSIDTSKPGVAEAAISAGAVVINDVTGFRDPAMVALAVESGCAVVILHMMGSPADMHLDPHYVDVVGEVEAFLTARAEALLSAGVDQGKIAIDPGLGFGKRWHHSLALLNSISRFAAHGYPVMIGASRKGFLSKVAGAENMDDLDMASAVTTALGFARGARLFRVHDVAKSRAALGIAAANVASQ